VLVATTPKGEGNSPSLPSSKRAGTILRWARSPVAPNRTTVQGSGGRAGKLAGVLDASTWRGGLIGKV
jgi:hypothetical protein